jgi:hypothetical protein
MQYGKPYTYFLNREGGTKGLLLGCLVLLLPVVGPMVFTGYQAEVTEDLERDPDTLDHDPFDLKHFSRYLTRGVWPFLMSLIVQAITMIFFAVAIAAAAGVGYAAQNFLVGYASFYLFLIPATFLATLFSLPLMLHVQLAGELRVGAAFAFSSRFLGKLWGQCLITIFVHMLISTLIGIVGYAMCCVGIIPAVIIISMAQDHLSVQLYRIYLAEGGEPIGSAAENAEYDDEDN